jgi:methylated-DNA-[protein]-cysteine S-methyltransferase
MGTHSVIDSAVGPLTLVAREGAIVGLYMDRQRHRPAHDTLGELGSRGCEAEPFKSAADQLGAYFAGTLRHFTLPLAPRGSPLPAAGLGRPSGYSLRAYRVLR